MKKVLISRESKTTKQLQWTSNEKKVNGDTDKYLHETGITWNVFTSKCPVVITWSARSKSLLK